MTDTVKQKEISFDIYKIISSSRNKHGVSTEDHNIYRRYLTKQLAVLRKKLKLQCLDPQNGKNHQTNNAIQNKLKKERLKKIKSGKLKIERDPKWNPKYKKYSNKVITWRNREIRRADLIKNGAECLLISLFLCERAWSYSKSIYEQYDEDNKRKYHHSNSRLKKSIFYANKLFNLLLSIQRMNKDTICQSFGYLCWLKSIYYLQTEQIELSFIEYLKSIKITHHSLSYLDNNLNEKLSYFNQNINKQQRIQIEKNVNKFIKDLKEQEKLQLADEQKEEKKEEDISVFIQYNENKIIIPNIDNLQELIKLLLQIKIKIKIKIKTETKMNSFKKMLTFTNIVLIIEDALNIIQKELKKIETNNYFLIEKYLLFEKLRFTICRQYLWIKNKNKTQNKHKILYELAVLSELQIKHLDELSTINDLTNYKIFMQQIDILRNLFEIYRKYFIAKIYYFSIKNYMNSYQILYHDVINQCNHFLNKFNQFNQINSNSNMYDFAQLIDINYSKKIMENILNDSNKLLMLSKANSIISNAQNNSNTLNSNALEVIDLNSNNKLYPLLTKPIMIDIAWNFVDYHDILASQKNKNDTKPKPPQQQASWFGGLFGGK